MCLQVKFGHGEWVVGSVYYEGEVVIPLAIIISAVIVPMLLFIAVSVYCYRFDKPPEETHLDAFFLCVSSRVCVCLHEQEEESAGGARIREGETPAGESGGECSRSLQEGVHRYTPSPGSREATRLAHVGTAGVI